MYFRQNTQTDTCPRDAARQHPCRGRWEELEACSSAWSADPIQRQGSPSAWRAGEAGRWPSAGPLRRSAFEAWRPRRSVDLGWRVGAVHGAPPFCRSRSGSANGSLGASGPGVNGTRFERLARILNIVARIQAAAMASDPALPSGSSGGPFSARMRLRKARMYLKLSRDRHQCRPATSGRQRSSRSSASHMSQIVRRRRRDVQPSGV